jgi:hypothetical protein
VTALTSQFEVRNRQTDNDLLQYRMKGNALGHT